MIFELPHKHCYSKGMHKEKNEKNKTKKQVILCLYFNINFCLVWRRRRRRLLGVRSSIASTAFLKLHLILSQKEVFENYRYLFFSLILIEKIILVIGKITIFSNLCRNCYSPPFIIHRHPP